MQPTTTTTSSALPALPAWGTSLSDMTPYLQALGTSGYVNPNKGTSPYYGDLTDPATYVGLNNAYGKMATLQQLQDVFNAYQQQYGHNPDTDSLMRAINEPAGLYLWGPNPGSPYAIPAGATVASPTAKNVTANGVYQGGGYTPNATTQPGTPGSTAIAPNSAYTAPLTNNPLDPFYVPGISPITYLKGTAANPNPVSAGGGSAPAYGGASGGGSTTFGASGPVDSYGSVGSLVDAQNGGYQGLIDQQNREQSRLFGRYGQAVNNQEKLPALYNRLANEMGVPQLAATSQGFQNQILNVQQLLGNLTNDINSRNTGTFTTQAQANRQIAAEGDPLRSQLSNLGFGLAPIAQALSSAQTNLGTQMTLNQQQQAKELTPLEMQINSLSDKYAREITGFTAESQNQLTALMDKLTRERQLSDREWQSAQDLAASERAFQQQKDLATFQFSLDQKAADAAAARAKAAAANTPKIGNYLDLNTAVKSGGVSTPSAADVTKWAGLGGVPNNGGLNLGSGLTFSGNGLRF